VGHRFGDQGEAVLEDFLDDHSVPGLAKRGGYHGVRGPSNLAC
jgi:hypothetical protein